MVDTKTIVNQYIYRLSNGENIKLEDYLKGIFGELSKGQLKKYCDNQNIYYKSNFNKEMLFQSIYGSCNSILGYRILSAKTVENETRKEFYYKLYVNFKGE